MEIEEIEVSNSPSVTFKKTDAFDEEIANFLPSFKTIKKYRGQGDHAVSIRTHRVVTANPEPDKLFSDLGEGVKIQQWKLEANLSAKLIGYNQDYVTLECLLDKESYTYEERDFNSSLFEGFDLNVKRWFKVCLYSRANQEMIEIKDGSKLVAENDFPSVDFFEEFKDLKLIKKSD